MLIQNFSRGIYEEKEQMKEVCKTIKQVKFLLARKKAKKMYEESKNLWCEDFSKYESKVATFHNSFSKNFQGSKVSKKAS